MLIFNVDDRPVEGNHLLFFRFDTSRMTLNERKGGSRPREADGAGGSFDVDSDDIAECKLAQR